MDLSNNDDMGADMLYSQVKMNLRNEYSDLHDPALSLSRVHKLTRRPVTAFSQEPAAGEWRRLRGISSVTATPPSGRFAMLICQ